MSYYNIMSKHLTKISIVTILFFFLHCASSPGKSPKSYHPSDPFWNEISDFISGIETPESKFYSFSSSSNYKNYSKSIDAFWSKIQTDYISHVTTFSNEKLPAKYKNNTGFYPLSGADFINLYFFSPGSPRYIMVGLEPPGMISDPSSISTNDLNNGLNSVISIMSEISAQNYFTRKRMKREFANKHFSGTLPVMLIFLNRLGMVVDYVRKIGISPNGEILEYSNIIGNNIEGNQIFFHPKSNPNDKRELLYFKLFINENSWEESTPEGAFFNKSGRLNVVMKSAEYVMQQDIYKSFLHGLIQKTDYIVQDDSAIPLNILDNAIWEKKAFGEYNGRIKLQNTPNVPDQKELFELIKEQKNQLPFKFGYGVLKGADKSNLMIICRK